MDRLAEKRREYVRNNKELVKSQQAKARKTFYKKRKDKVLQWNREYRAQNYEAYLARTCRERQKRVRQTRSMSSRTGCAHVSRAHSNAKVP